MRTTLSVLVVVLALWSLPCRADWGQAESPDFALDTSVPEPVLLAAATFPLVLLLRRYR